MLRRRMMWSVFVSFVIFLLGYTSDARLAGMGNLSLIFQDDFYRLDLYDFANIPAGFYRNDSLSSYIVRGSVLKESWGIDSITYLAVGQAVPQKLVDYAPVEAVAFYEVIPQFRLVPCEFIYTSRRNEETYDFAGNLLRPEAYRISVGYSYLSRDDDDVDGSDVVKTPSLSFVYAKQLSGALDFGLSGDIFYGVANTADKRDKVSLIPIGGGLGIGYNRGLVRLGLSAEYHYPMFTYTHTVSDGDEYSEHFRGHALSPIFGAVVNVGEFTWASACDYKWISLGGSFEGEPMGDLEISGYAAKTQVLYIPSFVRLTGFAQYNYRKPVYTNEGAQEPWFETAFKDYTFGGGIGVVLREAKIGIEGLYKNLAVDDKLYEETITSNELSIKCGAELGLAIENCYLRGGYNYSRFDPDAEDTLDADDCSIINTVTTGLGINVFKNTRIDIAYNYKWTRNNLLPDERVTDHIVFLYFKHIFKRELF